MAGARQHQRIAPGSAGALAQQVQFKGPFVPEPALTQEAPAATQQQLVVAADGKLRVAVAVADQLLVRPRRGVVGAQGAAVPDRVVVRVVGDMQIPLAVADQRRATVVVIRLADGVGLRSGAAAAVEGADPHPEPVGDRVEPRDVHGVAERDDLVLLRVRGGATAPVGGEELTCHSSLQSEIVSHANFAKRMHHSHPATVQQEEVEDVELRVHDLDAGRLVQQVLDSVALTWRMNHGEFGALSGQAAG